MNKFWHYIFFLIFFVAIFFTNTVNAAPQQKYPQAPIDEILKHQSKDDYKIKEYRKSIVRSYSLTPSQLQDLLNAEYTKINNYTERMQKIKKNWNSFSYAYRFVNYQLNAQISKEMTKSRKSFIKRKKQFNDLLKNYPNNKLYVIEATDPLFFYRTVRKNNGNKGIQLQQSAHDMHYLSVFDYEFQHLFTYHRQHVNMLLGRRMITPTRTKNERVNRSFQKLFDDYITDMKRIGNGLDINNQDTLAKIADMKNEFRSE